MCKTANCQIITISKTIWFVKLPNIKMSNLYSQEWSVGPFFMPYFPKYFFSPWSLWKVILNRKYHFDNLKFCVWKYYRRVHKRWHYVMILRPVLFIFHSRESIKPTVVFIPASTCAALWSQWAWGEGGGAAPKDWRRNKQAHLVFRLFGRHQSEGWWCLGNQWQSLLQDLQGFCDILRATSFSSWISVGLLQNWSWPVSKFCFVITKC